MHARGGDFFDAHEQRLSDVNLKLGAIYFECMRKNAETVMEYPELARQYRQKMEKTVTDS